MKKQLTKQSIAAAIILLLFLSGCGISNEEIVKQVKYCQENGLKPIQIISGLTYKTERIECRIKESK